MQNKKSGCSSFSLIVLSIAAIILAVCFAYPDSPFNPFHAPKKPAAGHGNPKVLTFSHEVNMSYFDLEQLYGPEYKFSDHKRGERIRYRAYDGQIRTGEILWVQEPGEAVGRDGKRLQIKAQYVIAPDSDTGMVDFVNLGDVQSE